MTVQRHDRHLIWPSHAHVLVYLQPSNVVTHIPSMHCKFCQAFTFWVPFKLGRTTNSTWRVSRYCKSSVRLHPALQHPLLKLGLVKGGSSWFLQSICGLKMYSPINQQLNNIPGLYSYRRTQESESWSLGTSDLCSFSTFPALTQPTWLMKV